MAWRDLCFGPCRPQSSLKLQPAVCNSGTKPGASKNIDHCSWNYGYRLLIYLDSLICSHTLCLPLAGELLVLTAIRYEGVDPTRTTEDAKSPSFPHTDSQVLIHRRLTQFNLPPPPPFATHISVPILHCSCKLLNGLMPEGA